MSVPGYLLDVAEQYEKDPRGTNLAWFKNAKTGLFMHYGLYSLLGRADYKDILRNIGGTTEDAYGRFGREWAQYVYKIPVANYERLTDYFAPDRFNVRAIVSFAKECGFDYINLTTRHHDGFCLWESADTLFNSVVTVGRDLVRELYEECERQHMAIFFYYSHGRDWRHPHAPNNDEWGGNARPEYDPPEPSYAYGASHDVGIYAEFVKRQVLELIKRFPNVAGIWFDGIAVPQAGPKEKMNIPELYEAIRAASPQALISYKQGITGTEDFFAPEHGVPDAGDSAKRRGMIRSGAPIEVCMTVSDSWGYVYDSVPKSAETLADRMLNARENGYKLLINSGPMDDGALNPADMDALSRAFKIANG